MSYNKPFKEPWPRNNILLTQGQTPIICFKLHQYAHNDSRNQKLPKEFPYTYFPIWCPFIEETRNHTEDLNTKNIQIQIPCWEEVSPNDSQNRPNFHPIKPNNPPTHCFTYYHFVYQLFCKTNKIINNIQTFYSEFAYLMFFFYLCKKQLMQNEFYTL